MRSANRIVEHQFHPLHLHFRAGRGVRHHFFHQGQLTLGGSQNFAGLQSDFRNLLLTQLHRGFRALHQSLEFGYQGLHLGHQRLDLFP